MTDTVDCPSCAKALDRGPDVCPHCGYAFGGDPTDSGRAERYRSERLEREAREWAESLPPPSPPKAAPLVEAETVSSEPGVIFTAVGWVAVVIAGFIGFIAVQTDVSGYGDYVNFDRMAEREMLIQISIGLGIIAAIFLMAGSIIDGLEAIRRRLPPPNSGDSE